MSKKDYKPYFASATYPEGTDQAMFEALLEATKPFATTVTLSDESNHVIIQSLPPEFDDDYTKWTDDQLTYYVHGLEFQVRAAEFRLGLEPGVYKWNNPTNQYAATEVKVQIGDEEYTRPPMSDLSDEHKKLRDIEDTLKLM